MGLFASTLFGALCVFRTCMSVSFTKLVEFSLIISGNKFSISCSFSSPSSTPMIWMLVCLKLSQRLLTLLSFIWILFSSCSDWMFFLSCVPNHWFDSWLHLLYCCFPINCSLFQLVNPLFLTRSFYVVEVLTKFLEHPYYQCFELCIWLLISI